ncbi:hypothetical protein [Bacteroides thetaiotaomicron]|nr:hypothetical protein [Bacteroides thetaiotaomicron]MCS3043427.1 hypothetical protein [Bacteroides thetaiotaomicron]
MMRWFLSIGILYALIYQVMIKGDYEIEFVLSDEVLVGDFVL